MMFGKLAHDPVRAFCKHPPHNAERPMANGRKLRHRKMPGLFSVKAGQAKICAHIADNVLGEASQPVNKTALRIAEPSTSRSQ